MNIVIINGPNLNLLGKRELGIYGKKDFDHYLEELKNKFQQVKFHYHQSNIEGEIVNYIQKGNDYDAIILNAAAYTHTSVAIADAIAAINTEVIEVHISNVFARESFRHHSYMSKNCVGVIAGFGLESYAMAVSYVLQKLKDKS